MTASGSIPASLRRPLDRVAGLQLSLRSIDWLVILTTVAASIIWALCAGKDLNWDQLNYHYFLPHALLGDRVSTDFMPANGQSYLNPLPYVPFYWMVTHHWHSIAIASVLAIIHSLNVIICYFITKALLSGHNAGNTALAAMGALLAFLSPVFLMETGTTFADISTTALVLAAVLCALHSDRPTRWWQDRRFIGGALLGAACGMKLSNLVFAPACALLIFSVPPSWSGRARALAVFAMGSAVGLIATQAHWGLQLWRRFGNPFFPYFGSLFPSEDFPAEGAALERFLPENIGDALLLPFRMVQLRAWIYIENVAPDLRFAALAILACLVGAYFLIRRRRAIANTEPLFSKPRLVAFCVFFAAAYVLWQWTSGNGRYGLVVSLLCGPLIVAATYRLTSRRHTALYLLAGLTALQLIHLSNGDLRWNTGEWTASWYEVSVPERLQREPSLYVSVGGNSNSYIYPFLSPDSVFTNPIGQMSFELDGPGGKPLRALLAKHRGHIRVLAMAPSKSLETDYLRDWVPRIDGMISRLGYAIDSSDCEVITAAGTSAMLGNDVAPTERNVRRLRTCRLIERPFGLGEQRARATKIAKEIVQWCPKLFKPAYTVLERTPSGWMANYPSTDSILIVQGENLIGVYSRAAANILLGTLTQWEQGVRPSCEQLPTVPRKTYTFD